MSDTKKTVKQNGLTFILGGIIITWFFSGNVSLLMDIVGALLLYIGMDRLTKDYPGFARGKSIALLLFGCRACLLASEWIFQSGSKLAVIFSCIFMVPNSLGFIMLLIVLSEGLEGIEKEYDVFLNAEKFKKNVKYYSIAAVTILMCTLFAILGASDAFSILMMCASVVGIVFILMLIQKIVVISKSYDRWRESGVVNTSWEVKEENGAIEAPQTIDLVETKEEIEAGIRTIYLAGGCFWGAEKYLGLIPGVVESNVGYANGRTENPSYEDVKYHHTGHAETVCVKYDTNKLSLERLLEKYFEVIDPVSVNKQGEDEGEQYRTGIYYTDRADLPVINKVYEKIAQEHEEPLAVEVLPLKQYFVAEEYHQKYLEKNADGYCHIDSCMFERAKEV